MLQQWIFNNFLLCPLKSDIFTIVLVLSGGGIVGGGVGGEGGGKGVDASGGGCGGSGDSNGEYCGRGGSNNFWKLLCLA